MTINNIDLPVQKKLALLRSLMIAQGVIAALTMNSLIFPRHCRVRSIPNPE